MILVDSPLFAIIRHHASPVYGVMVEDTGKRLILAECMHRQINHPQSKFGIGCTRLCSDFEAVGKSAGLCHGDDRG